MIALFCKKKPKKQQNQVDKNDLVWKTSAEVAASNSQANSQEINPSLVIDPNLQFSVQARWGEPNVPISIDKVIIDFNKELNGYLQVCFQTFILTNKFNHTYIYSLILYMNKAFS